ncbi:uncharacterized protein LOC132735708 [Ruditapes philippinarum]|uniref:uncharacterized protein LOC132735708 n=1 Tax=Ruditapes philippinarum TaxID=129788 RepID=UPI00295AE8BA|nr:uncharacterized protein LOC132735708 [Ruditapes philippinarum]XP_060578672.1 uncharacterized protein LOC132735708 [Ruditapes philippinarum]
MVSIGGLLVLLSMRVAAGQGDGWIMNITSNIYGFPWIPADKLSDRNSPRFKEAQNFFCGKINEMFRSEPVVGNAVKERYYRCFICNFKQTNLHFEAPVSFTYSLVFNGSDPVPKAVVDGLIASNTEIYHFGNKVWNLIGDWLVNRVDVTMVSVNMSDYIKQKKQEKQNPNIEIDIVVSIHVDLVNFTLTPELADPTSPEFTKLETSVCKDISQAVHGSFPSHKGCDVTSIVNNSVAGRIIMTINLTFGWDREVIYPHMIASLIIENAPRQVVNNEIVISIGNVQILERSFMKAANRAVQDTRDRPDNNPCFPDKNNVILPDMTNPLGYISCNHGNEVRFTCDQNMAFDPKTSKCVKSATVLA